jgi:GxxExxY protein
MPEIIYPELSYQVQGALYDVYNALRYQELSEAGWERALIIALADRGVSARQQAEYELRYKGYRIGRFFADIVAEEKIVLELKVEDHLLPIDVAQVLNYLGVTGLRLGILVNFGKNAIEIKRIPNFIKRQPIASPQETPGDHAQELQYSALTGAIRAILYEVHGELGPGFMHMHYRRATQIELRQREIPYDVKKEITIRFREQPIETRETRLLIIDKNVLVAPIAVLTITPALRTRFHQYLQLLGLKLGLIANFHASSLDPVTVTH